MKNLVFATITGLIITSSCAGVYKSMYSRYTVQDTAQVDQGVEFFYSLNTLKKSNNKMLARNARKKGLAVATVKIINHSNEAFVFGQGKKLYSQGQEVEIINSAQVHQSIKLQPAWQLLYMLLTPIQIPHRDLLTAERSKIPVGFYVAPVLAVLNIRTTVRYNSKFGRELSYHYLKNRLIKPGEAVEGLIAIPADQTDELILR